MAAGDFECNDSDIPGSCGDLELIIDVTHVQDKDRGGSQREGSGKRDGVHHAAVDVVLSPDLDRRQESRNSGGREQGVDNGAGREPVFRRILDTGSDTFEVRRQRLDIAPTEVRRQPGPKVIIGVQIRALMNGRPGATPETAGKQVAEFEDAPRLLHLPNSRGVGR